MAIQFDVNQTPASNAACMFQLKQLMKTAGWVPKSSSDGTTFNSSGDQITTGTSGAGGMNNANAWVRLQDAAGLREVVIFRASTTAYWIKYSASAKFTGGSPSASTPPTATDGQNVCGTSTAGATLFTGTEGALRCHCWADNAAPYGFGLVCYSNGGSSSRAFFCMDGLQAGAYNVLDQDPVVFIWVSAGANLFSAGSLSYICASASQAAGTQGVWGWVKYNLSGATWVNLAMLPVSDAGNPCIPGGLPASQYSAKEEVFDIPVGRYSGRVTATFKGSLKYLRWLGPQLAAGGDTINNVSSKDYLICDNVVAIPWNASSPTV